MKAVVLFSGGQDSTTCLGLALDLFDEVVAISFNYGQQHSIEIKRAKAITDKLMVRHIIVDTSILESIGDSALFKSTTRSVEDNRKGTELPDSYVPNRNAFFLTVAHAYAQKLGFGTIVTGVCETDYSGYPDCRQDFIDAIQKSLNLGSGAKILIHTPLMKLNKAQTFKLAEDIGVLDLVLNYSHTCYNGDTTMNEWGYGCGYCPSCKLRQQGFKEFKNENY